MVDINYTLLVQLANFVFLIVVLNALLLKPVMKQLKEREDGISSSHEEAKENADRAEAMLADFETELAAARVKAGQLYNGLQQEGMSAHRARLAEAKKAAQALAEEARAGIEADSKKAREILRAEMEKLPRDIAGKLLGRKL